MTEPLGLYISAASDLERERDVLARAVTEIPVDLGWRITQSPRGSQPVELEAVREADVHLLLLGSDIRAPVGQEWHLARRAGRRPVLLLQQNRVRTAAALEFIRYVGASDKWRLFEDSADLRRKVLALVAGRILGQAARFALSSQEVERLREWPPALEKAAEAPDQTRGGAGESSVIFSLERFEPSSGVLIRPPEVEGSEG